MNIYTRALILTAMAAVSLTQGCSCGSSNNSSNTQEPVVTTINGSASKGLISGGVVNIYPIIDSVISDTPLNAEPVLTEPTGGYTVSIDDYDGSPFVVRITSNSSTMMRCDLEGGCGDGVNFGDDYSVGEGFKLDAIVTAAMSTEDTALSVNLNVFTNAAAQVIANALASSTDIAALIANSNSAIANRFGITGDITQLVNIDLTDPAAVAAADPAVVLANSYGAAIIQALQSDATAGGGALTIEEAIANFATTFAINGLSDRTVDSSLTGLNEILEQAQQLIAAIQTAAAAAGVTLDLGSLVTAVANQIAFVNSQPASDTGSQGMPSDTNNATDLEKARALVAVLTDLGANIDMASLVEGTTIGSQRDELQLQLDAAELANSDPVEYVLEAVAATAEALNDAQTLYDDGLWTPDAEGVWPVWTSEDGIPVAISLGMDANGELESVSYQVGTAEDPVPVMVYVDGGMKSIDVYMKAKDMLATDESMSSEGAYEESVAGGVYVWGTAEMTDVIKLTIQNGSMVSVEEALLVEVEDDTALTSDLSVDELDLALSVVLQEVNPENTNPLIFTGGLSASLSLTSTETIPFEGYEDTVEGMITMASLSLSGSIQNATDYASFALTLEGDGTGITITEDSDTETATEYADASFAVMFDADLAGVSDAFTFQFSAYRTGYEAADVKIILAYPGIRLVLTHDYAESDSAPEITLINQDGVVLTVSDDEAEDDVTGTIYVGTTKLADIDGPTVRYTQTDANGETILDFLDIFSDDEEGDVISVTEL